MRRRQIRRWFAITALIVYVAAVAVALFIVWAPAERQWYLDAPQFDINLDIASTTTARWIATVVLGALGLIGLAALALEAFDARPGRGVSQQLDDQVDRTEETPAYQTGRYSAVIAGEGADRRSEQSLPPVAARAGDGDFGETDDLRESIRALQRDVAELKRGQGETAAANGSRSA